MATKRAATKPAPKDQPADDGDSERTETDEVAERTGPDAPHDDRFHHTFTVPPTRVIAEDDWADADGTEDLHNANKAALYEMALHRGVHPTDEATFDGTDTRADGSVDLHYSVPVRPAHVVEQPVVETVTPTVAIAAMGGTTTTTED